MNRLPVAALLLLGSFCFADMPAATTGSTTLVAPAAEENVPKSGIEVLKAMICKDVKDRECAEEVTTAKAGDVVVGWSQVRSGLGDVTITHRWLKDGEKVADVPLTLKGSPYRTWSRKTLHEPGKWTLQVVNPQGEVLKELSVTVEK